MLGVVPHSARTFVEEMTMTTPAIQARHILGCAQAGDYIDWAVDAMVAGFDSRNLRILAGLEPCVASFEAEEHFKRARRELNLPKPNREQALRDYAIHLAECILLPDSDFETLVAKLSELCHTNDYPDYLMEWYLLLDGLTDIRTGHYPHGYDELYQAEPRKIACDVATAFIKNNSEQDVGGQPATRPESK